MKATAAVLALACALAGCAQPTVYWVGPGDFKRDNYECDRESVTYGGGSGILGAIMILQAEKEARRLYVQCMEARGYARDAR